MSTTRNSTPSTPSPAGRNESYGFRETFLANFTQRGHATVLTILSTMLHEYALEFARHWPDPGEPPTRLRTRAAAADLKWLAGHLDAVGRERQESALAPKEQAISELAGKVAGEVARLAATLQEAVGKPPGMEEG